LHTIALRETGLILDQTTPTTFIAAVPGTTLVNTTAELGGTSSETFAFGSSYGTIIFALTAESSNEAEYTTPGGQFAFQGGSGQDVENISWVTQGGPPPDQTVISANNVSDFGTLSTGYQTGQITGTLTNLGDSTYRYSITAAGTTVTGTAASGISGFAGFDAIAIRETALTGQGNTWGISVSAPAQEQLTLTSVSTSGGNTLSVGGFCNNAVLEQIDISVNDGGTWAESNSFSSSGGSVAAPFSALGSMLGAGSYEIIVRDHSNPTVESNMLPLTVSGSGASGSRVQVFIF
jgi:hypothetical protein